MRVRVEGCCAGRNFRFRVTIPTGLPGAGSRFYVEGADWTRKTASATLDALTRLGARRSTIRFVHD